MRKITILGAGESGAGSAVLAARKGFDVFVSDKGLIKPVYKDILDRNGIKYEEGRHSEEKVLTADEVIKSPGIPDDNSLIVAIRGKGIPVISEIEFAEGTGVAARYVLRQQTARQLLRTL